MIICFESCNEISVAAHTKSNMKHTHTDGLIAMTVKQPLLLMVLLLLLLVLLPSPRCCCYCGWLCRFFVPCGLSIFHYCLFDDIYLSNIIAHRPFISVRKFLLVLPSYHCYTARKVAFSARIECLLEKFFLDRKVPCSSIGGFLFQIAFSVQYCLLNPIVPSRRYYFDSNLSASNLTKHDVIFHLFTWNI